MGYPELARILRRVGSTEEGINQRDARELFRDHAGKHIVEITLNRILKVLY